MKLRPMDRHVQKMPTAGWSIMGFVMSVVAFGSLIVWRPTLQSRWGLILFIPFAVAFVLVWNWFFISHPASLRRKVGESRAERQAYFKAIFGKQGRR